MNTSQFLAKTLPWLVIISYLTLNNIPFVSVCKYSQPEQGEPNPIYP